MVGCYFLILWQTKTPSEHSFMTHAVSLISGESVAFLIIVLNIIRHECLVSLCLASWLKCSVFLEKRRARRNGVSSEFLKAANSESF